MYLTFFCIEISWEYVYLSLPIFAPFRITPILSCMKEFSFIYRSYPHLLAPLHTLWTRRVFISKPGLYTIREYPPRSVWCSLSQLPLFSHLPTCHFTPTSPLPWGTRRPSSYLNISFLPFISLGLNGYPHKTVHHYFFPLVISTIFCSLCAQWLFVVMIVYCLLFLILNVLLFLKCARWNFPILYKGKKHFYELSRDFVYIIVFFWFPPFSPI